MAYLTAEIRGQITTATGRKAIATADAIMAELRMLESKKVPLATPYIESVHRQKIDLLGANSSGIRRRVDRATEMARMGPDAIAEQGNEVAYGCSADDCFISSAAIHSAGPIAGHAGYHGNQVLPRHGSRTPGINGRVERFGRLMERIAS